MSLQKNLEPKVLPPPTKKEKEEAQAIHQKILNTIAEVRSSEANLEHGYVTLGQLIFKMQKDSLWLSVGYKSWRDYFDFIQGKFGKGRTQLYGYIGTIKTLSPHIDDKTLSDMGISKAGELKKAVIQTGKAPSEDLVNKGLNPNTTISEFREAINKEFHIVDHNEKGTWYDLKGVYFTPEEKQTWEQAIDLAKNQDPVVSITLPGHAQLKEALMRLAEEFISTYGFKETDIKFETVIPQDNTEYSDFDKNFTW